MAVDERAIEGTWLHSREEDDGNTQVFRPEGYDFPPARGRSGYTFAAGGAAQILGPGPDDRRGGDPGGAWSLAPDGKLTITAPGGGTQVLSVRSATSDKLELEA